MIKKKTLLFQDLLVRYSFFLPKKATVFNQDAAIGHNFVSGHYSMSSKHPCLPTLTRFINMCSTCQGADPHKKSIVDKIFPNTILFSKLQ